MVEINNKGTRIKSVTLLLSMSMLMIAEVGKICENASAGVSFPGCFLATA